MPVAGKTGTTSDDKDLVFAGYTPYYAAGIWMGYDTPKKISYDKSYHLIVWRAIMDQLHDNLPYKEFEKPDGIMTASYCAIQNAIPISGVCAADYYGAGYYGNMVSTGYCVEATAPKSECTAHSIYRICKESGHLAGPNCPDDVVEELSLAVVNGQIVNRPSKESCAQNGKIYVDISQTCSLTSHSTSSHNNNDDIVIGGDIELPEDTDGHTDSDDDDDEDGHEFVIGAD